MASKDGHGADIWQGRTPDTLRRPGLSEITIEEVDDSSGHEKSPSILTPQLHTDGIEGIIGHIWTKGMTIEDREPKTLPITNFSEYPDPLDPVVSNKYQQYH